MKKMGTETLKLFFDSIVSIVEKVLLFILYILQVDNTAGFQAVALGHINVEHGINCPYQIYYPEKHDNNQHFYKLFQFATGFASQKSVPVCTHFPSHSFF